MINIRPMKKSISRLCEGGPSLVIASQVLRPVILSAAKNLASNASG
jgi:hypothetical protein